MSTMWFTYDTCVSWSPRNYKPRVKSVWIRTAMDYRARSSARITLSLHNTRFSCFVAPFLSRHSQHVQFNATVLKRVVPASWLTHKCIMLQSYIYHNRQIFQSTRYLEKPSRYLLHAFAWNIDHHEKKKRQCRTKSLKKII